MVSEASLTFFKIEQKLCANLSNGLLNSFHVKTKYKFKTK